MAGVLRSVRVCELPFDKAIQLQEGVVAALFSIVYAHLFTLLDMESAGQGTGQRQKQGTL